eukprot:g17888.t1
MVSSSAELDCIDRDIAIFLLILCIGFLAVGAVVMVLFWRERNAFEIHQRSAYLVMLTGASFLARICNIMVDQAEGVFGYEKAVNISVTVKYFVIVCSTSCYGSRTIRLWLRYNDRHRRAVPWLVPERYHVVACFLFGVAAMTYPLSYFENHVENESSEEAFAERADTQLWIISMACKVVVIGLYPLVRSVQDIFNLQRELFVVSVVLLVHTVVYLAVDGLPLSVTRWVDGENLNLAGAIIKFSISVIHPIKERLLHPMESCDPNEIEALKKRKATGLRSAGVGQQAREFWRKTRRTWSGQNSGMDPAASGQNYDVYDDDYANTVVCGSASNSPGAWTYDRVMSTPEISAAFEEFSRNALCQESFLFLKAATTYERVCASLEQGEGEEDGGGGGANKENVVGREGDDGADEEAFALLAEIVRDYIADGSPNEINISSRDKRDIFEVYKLGKEGFRELPPNDKRSVFAKAFSEIRCGLRQLENPGTNMESSSVKLDGIDRDIAIFLLVFAIGFLAVGAVVTVLFWRERKAFQIHQRSAYLVMLTGVSFLAVICKIMVNQVEGVFGYDKNVYIAKTVKYFAIVCSTCCYGSRTIRLWLGWNDRWRKALPWLVPERPHVVVCFLLGVAAMIYPVDYMATHSDSDSTEAEFVDKADEQLWTISLVAKVIVIGLFSLVWRVDDIFKLKRELLVMSVVLLAQISVGRPVLEKTSLSVRRWVDDENLDFAGAVIMFSLSVIHPIKERLMRPMESSDPEEVEALEKRKGKGLGLPGMTYVKQTHSFSWRSTRSWFRKDSDIGAQTDDDDANTSGFASDNNSPGTWTYERVVSTPEVSMAFEEFSRKALCQESFFFLKDAMMYQTSYFPDIKRGEVKDNGGDGHGERMRSWQGSADMDDERFAFLARIVRDYISDGAPNEINISSRDKRSILEVYKLGKEGFSELPVNEKRSVLARAYSEIRFMLESNLMRKFLSTDGFKEAEAADRANDAFGVQM